MTEESKEAREFLPWPKDTYVLSVTFSAKSLEGAAEKVDLLMDILDEHYPHWSVFVDAYERCYPEEFAEDGEWIGF